MNTPVIINTQLQIRCEVCGKFSPHVCVNCVTNPLDVKYAALQTKVREYLGYGSIDGKAERQTLRKELAEMVK